MKTLLTLTLCLLSTTVLAESEPYIPKFDAMSWEILAPAAVQIDHATVLAPSISNCSTQPLLLSLTPTLRHDFSDPGSIFALGADQPFTVGTDRELLAFDQSHMRCRGVQEDRNLDDYVSATLQLWPDEGYARIYEFIAQHVFFPDQSDFSAFTQYWFELYLEDQLWVAFPPGISDDGTWTRLPGPIAYEPIEHANFNREVRLPLHRAAGPDLFTRGIMTTVGKLELLLVFRDKPAHPGQRELFYLIGNRGDRKVLSSRTNLQQRRLRHWRNLATLATLPMIPGQPAMPSHSTLENT